jgi:hypothetical protein
MRVISSRRHLRGRLYGSVAAGYDDMWEKIVLSRFVSVSCSEKRKVQS